MQWELLQGFARKKGIESYLCSSDKDLCQLVDDKSFIVHTHKNNLIFGKEQIIEKYGITPRQFIDYLAIVGDSQITFLNKRIWAKNCIYSFTRIDTLQKLLDNAHTLSNKKRAKKIEEERNNAEISYKLATIDVDLDIPTDFSFYENKKPDIPSLKSFYEKMEFNSLLKEIETKTSSTHLVKAPKGIYTLIK